ncbi:hypothetical protein ACFY3O_29585 [Streptomyces sp. NPDC001046]|uniref:hypothetical protein n=1 Tax=unclassified Streptomyces TaxID=2593676 RepID=UPI0036A5ED6F
MTAVSCRTRRTVRTAVHTALSTLSEVRSCPYCRAWTAPRSVVCPSGHRLS